MDLEKFDKIYKGHSSVDLELAWKLDSKTRKFHLSVVVNEAYNVWAKSDTFARWSFMITATLQVTQCSHLMDSGLISCKLFLQDQTTFKGQDQVISWSMKYRKKNFATWFRKE